MPCYLQLAKNGDLCSLIPILHHDFVTTGVKSTLIVAPNYRQIPEAVDYINTVVYPGSDMDLEGAIKFAKTNFDKVRICQLHGKGFEFQHRRPSFQYDQWERAGALQHWDTLPLILPRKTHRDVEIPLEPYILFADHSQSSPFFHKDELATALLDSFPMHKIIRLSEALVKDLLALLPLYDAADLIVSTDTLHLHLAKATQTPLIALVSDTLSRWHGSAFSHRYAMHCRYKDYPRRKVELLRIAQDCLDKIKKVTASPELVTKPGGYNLSMIQHGNSIIATHRYHPERDWKTKIAIYDGITLSDVIFPAKVSELSQEDARLFHHNGKLMVSYVLATAEFGEFRCVVGYGMLVQREGRWHVDNHCQPEFTGNDYTGLVKNWCPFVHDGKIHFVWGIKDGNQIVIEVDGEKVTKEYRTPAPTWDYGEIRGGVLLPDKGCFVRFFHSRSGGDLGGENGSFQYHMGALLMDNKPPFRAIKVGNYPIVSGDERFTPGCFHWKPNVAIPYGAVRNGGEFWVSIGRNDCACEVLKVGFSDLHLD